MKRYEVELQGYIERYLAGRLRGRERESFEVFWFVSDEGFDDLRRGLTIRAGFGPASPIGDAPDRREVD